jgi:D-tyrosyl-tRNA(Tyr) deacylase
MKAIIQRCKGPTIVKFNDVSHSIAGYSLVAFICWEQSDEARSDLVNAEKWIRDRVFGLRVFPDSAGRLNLNLSDFLNSNPSYSTVEAGVLWVSQFTLSSELESGYRPSFTKSMNPTLAQTRWNTFVQECKSETPQGLKSIFGQFGADMSIVLENWGPVTIPLTK